MKDSETGIEVALEYDEDGFPIVRVDVQKSGSYYDEAGNSTVEIWLDGKIVRPMFLESDSI